MPVEIFCSYAHEDEIWLRKLEVHLSLLKRQGLLSLWHDRLLVPGSNWSQVIDTHVETASVILLLVSADFFASNYCYGIEMERALARQKSGEAQVIPILLRPVDWEASPLAHLHALPTNAKPITTWSNKDNALADIAAGIRRVLEDLSLPHASVSRNFSPAIWNIPYSRNPVFTGREEILVHLADRLKAGQAMALSQADLRQPQAISGLGGIGKTQIAVEYAYRSRQEYQVVLWIEADTRESLVSGYTDIAVLLKLPEKDARDQQITIQAVKTWLQTHGSWLLILDNADDLMLAREFIPPLLGGHLLLTTRAQSMGRLAERIEVDTMDRNVGALFLLRRIGLIAQNASLGTASPEDEALAHEICEDLGGLPLALDQAGAYIEEVQCSLLDYQQRYRTRRKLLLKRRGGLAIDHPEPVATTWSLSFEKVEQRSPSAADLLRVCALLHPDDIPVEFITKGATHLGPPLALVAEDDVALDEAIAILGAYSLIRRNVKEKTLSIHRLVQAVLQDGMDKETKRQWSERMVHALSTALPNVEFTTWPLWERYLPHALRCTQLIEQEKMNTTEAARLLNQVAWYLNNRARYAEAELLYQHALRIWKQQPAPDHPDMTDSLDGLGRLYREQGKYAEAEPLYLHALRIWKQQPAPDHPNQAYALHGLGRLYREQGKYAEAEPLYLHALRIREKRFGPEDPQVAYALDGLANLYREQGKYAEAESLFLHALQIRKKRFEAERPQVEVAWSLDGLAILYREQGKYEQAERLFKQALTIFERDLGETHHDTARSLNNLAVLYQMQGRDKEAEPLFKRALLIYKQTLGEMHPQMQNTLRQYVLLLQKLGLDEEASGYDAENQEDTAFGIAPLTSEGM